MLTADSRRISLHRRLENTRQALDDIRRRREAMSTAAQALLSRADELVAFARTALDERWAATEAFPEPGRELVRRIACDDMLRLFQELSETLLPALRGANSSKIPVELTAALEDAARSAAGGTVLSVVTYAAAAYNYSIQYYGDPLTELAPLIAPFAPPPPISSTRFLFLSLPELERDSSTLHSVVIGHEIGHLRDWVNGITNPLNVAVPPEWLDQSGALKPAYIDAVPFFRAVVAGWATELVSDIFAALTLGPASLFALLELLTSVTEFTADSRSHPAGDRRLFVILMVLDRLRFTTIPEVAAILAPLRGVAAKSQGRPVVVRGHTERSPQLQEAAVEGWTWLQRELPALVNACEGAIQDPYAPSQWADVQWAAEQLDRGQPCGERLLTSSGSTQVRPVPPATVLNAAWLNRLRRHPGLAGLLRLSDSASEQAQLDAVVDGLVLKSLEISSLRTDAAWT